MISVESFDVFDTVLTRAVGSPEAVFLVLGRRLAQQSLIAQGMRGDIAGLKTVSDSLSLGLSTVNVALSAAQTFINTKKNVLLVQSLPRHD